MTVAPSLCSMSGHLSRQQGRFHKSSTWPGKGDDEDVLGSLGVLLRTVLCLQLTVVYGIKNMYSYETLNLKS